MSLQVEVQNPATGQDHIVEAGVLIGGDYSAMFDNYDGAFTPEQIQKYYDTAMAMEWEDGWYSTPEMKAEGKSSGYKQRQLLFGFNQINPKKISPVIGAIPSQGAFMLLQFAMKPLLNYVFRFPGEIRNDGMDVV